ncbi:MAG: hypothetical protein ACFE95_13170, partial [Candidatus Hodarchaeota archaeon]
LYIKAATETVDLIGKLLSFLIETNKMEKFDDFLNQINIKADNRISSMQERSFNSTADKNVEYWEGVRDVSNLAKNQWIKLRDINMFNIFLINCVPSLKADIASKRIDRLNGFEDIMLKEMDYPSDQTYTETAIRTLNLIRRTLKHFEEIQETKQFFDFINQMKTRAEAKLIMIDDQTPDEDLFIPGEREKTKYYWQAIYDMARIASNQWVSIQNPNQLYEFTKGIEASIIRQERINLSELSEDIPEMGDYIFPESKSSSIIKIKETLEQVETLPSTESFEESETPYLDDSLKELSHVLSNSIPPSHLHSQNEHQLLEDTQILPKDETEPVLDKAKILKEALIEWGFESPEPTFDDKLDPSSDLANKLLSDIESEITAEKSEEDDELALALRKSLKMLRDEI